MDKTLMIVSCIGEENCRGGRGGAGGGGTHRGRALGLGGRSIHGKK